MQTSDFNKIFKRTVSVQVISVWTVLVVASYFVGEVWLNNNLLTYLILWLVGALGLGRIISLYYRTDTRGKDSDDRQISGLIYRAILETSPDSVAATDLLGNYIFANKQTAVLHGYDTTDEFIGKSALSLFPMDNVAKAVETMNLTFTDGVVRNIEFKLLRKDGSTIPAELSAAVVKNEFGAPVAFIAITRDITERKRVADELHDMNVQLRAQLNEIEKLQGILREQAIQDPLTGLYNRRYMEEALKRESARATREGYPLSIVMLDMDNLKYLNDTHGHVVGDDAIKMIGKSIKNNIRTEDIACRYGGDEFLVILHNTTAETAKHRVEEWLNHIKERTFIHNKQEFKTTFSAGIATFPYQGNDIEGVIRSADNALYNAKTKGKNLVVISTEVGASIT